MHTTSITFTNPETPTCEVPSNGFVEISLLTVCTGETSHCALENGADLHVNERQKIRHYRVRSTEERRIRRRRRKKKNAKSRFFYFARCVRKLALYMLYTYSIGNQPWNTMVVFKMRDIVPSARYSIVCNVLRQRRICYDNRLSQ